MAEFVHLHQGMTSPLFQLSSHTDVFVLLNNNGHTERNLCIPSSEITVTRLPLFCPELSHFADGVPTFALPPPSFSPAPENGEHTQEPASSHVPSYIFDNILVISFSIL